MYTKLSRFFSEVSGIILEWARLNPEKIVLFLDRLGSDPRWVAGSIPGSLQQPEVFGSYVLLVEFETEPEKEKEPEK